MTEDEGTPGVQQKDPTKLTGGFLKSQGKRGDINPRVKTQALSKAAMGEEAGTKKATSGRRTALTKLGVSPAILKEEDKEYAQCVEHSNKYLRHRRKELQKLHGHVSAGVSMQLANAALATGVSRFLYQELSKELAKGNRSDALELAKLASKLAGEGRQCELAAWEMCAREGVLKKRMDSNGNQMPWLVTDGGADIKTNGMPKVKTGRKTNEQRKLRESGSGEVADLGTGDGGVQEVHAEVIDGPAPWEVPGGDNEDIHH